MHPKRFGVKLFVTEPGTVELSKFVPIFQRWIQRSWVEGLLIDVAAYEHVQQGPGIILIGDEGDYALDIRDGRPGLLYTRKRQMADKLTDSLRVVTRLSLIAAQKLTAEPTIKGIGFDYSQFQVYFFDRLNTPNTPEALAAVKPELEAFATALYAGSSVTVELAYTDPREPLSVYVKAPAHVSADTLIERLTAGEIVNS